MNLKQQPYTEAGKLYLKEVTQWLQDTRLMSEAIYRLYQDHRQTGRIKFAEHSWPKPTRAEALQKDHREFEIEPVVLAQRMDSLTKVLWASRFIFLETLWEEYLQNFVIELKHKDATIFEPFCERDFMAGVVRDVLTDQIDSIQEIKDAIATRFATGITRQSWDEQWKQLRRLSFGLSEKDAELSWYNHVDVYFEMRNCIIHQQGRVSPLLFKKSDYFQKKSINEVEIWPQHLDFYRHQFIQCVMHIEAKVRARFEIAPSAQTVSSRRFAAPSGAKSL